MKTWYPPSSPCTGLQATCAVVGVRAVAVTFCGAPRRFSVKSDEAIPLAMTANLYVPEACSPDGSVNCAVTTLFPVATPGVQFEEVAYRTLPNESVSRKIG